MISTCSFYSYVHTHAYSSQIHTWIKAHKRISMVTSLAIAALFLFASNNIRRFNPRLNTVFFISYAFSGTLFMAIWNPPSNNANNRMGGNPFGSSCPSIGNSIPLNTWVSFPP